MITRRWLTLLVAGVLAVAALVAVRSLSDEQVGSKPDGQVGPTAQSNGPDAGPMKMQLTDAGVTIDVPRAAYVSQYNEKLNRFDPPAPVSPGPITLAAREDPKRANQPPVVYVTDGRQKVIDVMVTGGARLKGRLIELQWLLTKDGVELVWDAQGHDSWVVRRDGKTLTTSASGRYLDPGRVKESRRYVVSLVEQVEITVDGETQRAEGGTDYVLFLPAFDSSLLGQPVPKVSTTRRPGLGVESSAERTAAATSEVAEDREVARFLEWNSFIGEEYVPSSFCGAGNEVDKFGGDDRGFSNVPARDAFEADGTTRSRITSRVGSSWSLVDDVDLNAQIYDDWFYRATGTSHAYTQEGELLRQGNTGAATMVLKESWSNGDRAWRLVEVGSPNPLCSLGPTGAWH